MDVSPNGVTIYRLEPEELEKLLLAKYGRKIAAVKPDSLAKLNEKRAKYEQANRSRTEGRVKSEHEENYHE
jgi:hypothetical protein